MVDAKITVGFLILSSFFLGGIIGNQFDTSKPIYYCKSLDMYSDCLNGIKATGKWCYYNTTSPTKYKVCSEGWQLWSPPSVENQKQNIQPLLTNNNEGVTNEICYVGGCTK
jgi:hypothetical protein